MDTPSVDPLNRVCKEFEFNAFHGIWAGSSVGMLVWGKFLTPIAATKRVPFYL